MSTNSLSPAERPPSQSSPAHESLPTPSDRPSADVVLYDGACRICVAQAVRLNRWDATGRLAYLSIHDPEVARRWPDISHARLLEEMCVVDGAGSRHWGPYAVRYLTRLLPCLWWAAPLLHVPGSMWIGAPLYRWIARNRYRLSGTACPDDACRIGGPSQRGSFPGSARERPVPEAPPPEPSSARERPAPGGSASRA